MKLRILILILPFLVSKGLGQNISKASKILDNIEKIKIRDMGAIKENYIVKGYYVFYQHDIVDKHRSLFRLTLWDENLNDIGTKDIEGPDDWQLLNGVYDGEKFCFKFYDPSVDTFELKVFDIQANELVGNNITINYNPHNHSSTDESDGNTLTPGINVVDNNGFLSYAFCDSKDEFIISYENGTAKKSWQTTYEPVLKNYPYLNFLGGNSEMLLTQTCEYDKGKMYHYGILANDIKNGNLLFNISTDFDSNYIMPKAAVFKNDKINLIGFNLKLSKDNERVLDGFAFIELDKKGKVLSTRITSFRESISKYMPITTRQLNSISISTNILLTKNNTMLVVVENVLLAPNNSIDHKNMLVMEFDQNGNVLQSKELPKLDEDWAKHPASPIITLRNEDNSQVSFGFRDYGKMDENSHKTSFYIQAKYDNGRIDIDKIPIADEDNTDIFPSKPGSIFEIEYHPKEKDLSMDIIKLNN
jgi:hypothetical protein